MSQTSPRLTLPFIQPSQAQKHVTHNEALRALDLLVQLSIEDDALDTPPAGAAEGECYIVGDTATGAWTGHDGEIAAYLDGAWQFQTPQPGWHGVVLSRSAFVIHDGTTWQSMNEQMLQNATALGLGMSSTETSPFSAKLNQALWTALYSADGGTGDLVQTLNKQSTSADVGFVFQENFQTRALLGLFGDNVLRVSVTPDGASFHDALRVDSATGITDLPALPRFKASTNYDNFIAANTWTKVGINVAEINDQSAFDASTNCFTAPVAGTYFLSANLIYKQDVNAAHLSSRMVANALDVIAGSVTREAGTQVSEETGVFSQTLVQLAAGDTVEIQIRTDENAYVMADNSTFFGYKVG